MNNQRAVLAILCSSTYTLESEVVLKKRIDRRNKEEWTWVIRAEKIRINTASK